MRNKRKLNQTNEKTKFLCHVIKKIKAIFRHSTHLYESALVLITFNFPCDCCCHKNERRKKYSKWLKLLENKIQSRDVFQRNFQFPISSKSFFESKLLVKNHNVHMRNKADFYK